jgi:2-dehydro-3-deoxyphosphogluconate aldolase/(4S)-4-hydroxy-2-oxoglutarate aldolase
MQSNLNPALMAKCAGVRVIPVLTISDVSQAVPLARALVAGGLTVLEITLRTPAALVAVQRIADEVPQAVVGAGTILSADQGREAIAAGATFLVSPGSSPRLLDAADTLAVPLLPGVATASEAMAALERGYRFVKFFPAEVAGGIAALKALAAPLAALRFCPTGGVGADNLEAYLALPNVVCVGGSWVAPAHLVKAGDWAGIAALAQSANAPAKGHA